MGVRTNHRLNYRIVGQDVLQKVKCCFEDRDSDSPDLLLRIPLDHWVQGLDECDNSPLCLVRIVVASAHARTLVVRRGFSDPIEGGASSADNR